MDGQKKYMGKRFEKRLRAGQRLFLNSVNPSTKLFDIRTNPGKACYNCIRTMEQKEMLGD